MVNSQYLFTALIAMTAMTTTVASLQCIGDYGKPVSYFVGLKEPQGTQYMYYDLSRIQLEQSANDMNSTGAVYYTMSQLWNQSASVEYMIWNDEPYNYTTYNFTYGHTKGIWAWDLASQTGIIIQHSLPQFPNPPTNTPTYKGLTSNTWTYGQHFSCFSMKLSDMVALAPLIQLNYPNIYSYKISANTPPALAVVAKGGYSTEPICSVMSVSGLRMFAKSTQWNNDLYGACIAPTLRESLYVESWRATLPSNCSTYDTVNVESLAYNSNITFSSYYDHSKWAISDDYVCVGDINRASTQYVRGGGAICFSNVILADNMKTAITSYGACPI